MRVGASPGAAATLSLMNLGIDIRAVLPAVHVPTLVLHREGDPLVTVKEARFVADRIPDATLRVLRGVDHLPWVGDQGAVTEEIEEFLTGARHTESDRVLATTLFTDIVGSTQKASDLGDARWKELLAVHDDRARSIIERHRGRFVDSAGDGLFATFDGPARAVRCAQTVGGAIRDLGVEIRAGCHTGEVELAGDRVRGIAVHIGARVAAIAGPSEVIVSSTVKDLVAGSGLTFEDAGEHELKGVPDRWRLYRVVP
jgi:class 3 adenylate cyclase